MSLNSMCIVTSHTTNKGSTLIKEDAGSDGKPAEWTDEDVESMSVSSGRTISLGNFEFARVGFGVKTGLKFPVEQGDRDKAYARMRDSVEEVLDREEAFIRGEDREFGEIDLNGLGVATVIWIDYGLTFKKKGMDSNKVDISSSRKLTDGSDFEDQVNVLEKEVGDRIGAYKAMVLGTDGNVGL